ncbi:MAG: TonB family protein [Bradyrhizobium sp.]|uniref:cell envelope integrity protein TolA n=1 Tax=Bradyrhizobium sp. TaxID=376 RepID=UPI001207D384|nr:energy transducer TonB [Bradyrhizobium sp.]THD70898.1 MAG: TonB family protein [Bradyrhizobium sp.]
MPDPDIEQKPSRRLWIFAAVAALALHVGGGALAVAHMQGADTEELGSPGIEIGLEFMSPRVEESDLPAGPDTDASLASPALAEQKAEVKQTELPKDTPAETDDPDRQVTLNDSQKPKEDDPKVATVQTSASMESAAQEATAMPTVEEAPEGKSQAPAQGTGKSLQRQRASWFAELSAHFEKHKRNPPLDKFKNTRVLVSVTFDRLGHVVSSSIAESSGDPAYDEAALAMLRRSDPVPQPPPLIADEGLTYTLPVVFRVKGRS